VVNKTVVSLWSVTVETISDSVVAEDDVDSVANVTAVVVIAGVVTTETEAELESVLTTELEVVLEAELEVGG
jgi:hypothetical protein